MLKEMARVRTAMWAFGPPFDPSDAELQRELGEHITVSGEVAERRTEELVAAGILVRRRRGSPAKMTARKK